MGASTIILGDRNKERLSLVKKAGFETVDLTKDVPIADQLEAILGEREVDCGVDCVGFEAHGYGRSSGEEDPQAVWNALVEVVRSGGGIGIPGVYTDNDPGGPGDDAKKGRMHIDFGKAWVKSQHAMWGQCPVMKYNRELMRAILAGRMEYLCKASMSSTSHSTRRQRLTAPSTRAWPKKFVIDPHGSVRKGKA